MFRGIVAFLVVWAAVAAGITVFRHMTVKEKFESVKLLMWSGLTAAIAIGLLTVAVIVF